MGEHADDTMNWDVDPTDYVIGDGCPQDVAIIAYSQGRRPQGMAYVDDSEDAELGRLGEELALAWVRQTLAEECLFDVIVARQWDLTAGSPHWTRVALNRTRGDIVLTDGRRDLSIEVKSTRRYAHKGTVSFPRHCYDECLADLLIGIGIDERGRVSFKWHRTMKSVREPHGHIERGQYVIIEEGPGFDLNQRLLRAFGTQQR